MAALWGLVAVLAATAARAEDPPRVLTARAVVTPAEVLPGDSAELAVTVTLEPGWHVNSHVPSEPYLIPTALAVSAPAQLVVGAVRYPPGEDRVFAFSPGKALSTYEGNFVLTVALTVASDATPGGAVPLRATLRYQACNDTRCLAPRTDEVTARLSVRAAAAAGTPDTTVGAGGVSPANASGARDLGTEGKLPTTGDAGGGPGSTPGAGAAPSPGGLLGADLARGVLARGDFVAYLGVFALGVLLNLTPCVYPLIAVTLAFFGGQAHGSRARVVGLALAYVGGIAITFSTLGTASAMSGAAFGTALQQPAVLLFIAATLLALAAANFGLWQLRVPTVIGRFAGRSGAGVGGALFMGLTMGLLAAPCVGPVLAGLILAVGARQDVAFGASVFFTLSLGLGAPYLLLATLAGTVRRLPRSGGWLAWMEHLLGVVLVGLALFYVEPLIPHVLRPIAWAALLASGGVYLGFVDPSGGDWPRFAHLKRAVGVVALAGAAWGFGGASSASPIRWEPLTAESLGVARNRAAPAVVDFTAEWCIPCREMDTTTFQDAEVIGVARGFAMLRADVTVIDDQTDALMREQRVLGVPTYLFFTAAGLEAARLVGYVAPAEFLRAMRAAAAAG